MAEESPQSQLWRDTFMQQLRSKPHASNYENICEDARKAADLAVKFYGEAFPAPITITANLTTAATPKPAKPGKT
jgi:hypothetical protein